MREMWELGVPYQIALVAFLIGSPPAVVYPVILGFLKWNESKVGRSMMFKGLALGMVFIQGLASMYFYSEPWYPWFVASVLCWLAFAVWYQTTTVIQTIIEGEIETRMESRPKAR